MGWGGGAHHLESTFTVAPGANPAAIQTTITGAKSVSLGADGNLSIAVDGGALTQPAPVAYEIAPSGAHLSVAVHFRLAGNHVSFAIATYNHSNTLVIDPTTNYSGYLGGTSYDFGFAVAVDSSGNAYYAGETDSSDFPTSLGAYQTTAGGGGDAFVTKVAANGQVSWSTYLGGGSHDAANAIAVDGSGHVWVAGQTYSSIGAPFPTAGTPYQSTLGTANSAVFVSELGSAGNSLIASTYVRGTSSDALATGLALDSSGNVYISGQTRDSGYPTTAGVVIGTYPTGSTATGFVTKLPSSLSSLTYSTFLGGTSSDYLTGIAVDSSNNAYVTGYAFSGNYPTHLAYQGTNNAASSFGSNAVITELNTTATGYAFSTFYGAGASTSGYGIALDSSKNVYVAGNETGGQLTYTTSFGGHSISGTPFLAKFAAGGASVSYTDSLGMGYANGVSVASNGTVLVGGEQVRVGGSDNNYIPMVNAWDGRPGADRDDGFVAQVASSGSQLLYSTLLAGSGQDAVHGIATDSSANAYVVGTTSSSDFPITNNLSYAGSGDPFVTKLDTNPVGGAVVAAAEFGGTGLCVACFAKDAASIHMAGDPIDTMDGNFWQSEVDFAIAGRGQGLNFTRTYNSLNAATNGPLGYGWSSNALASLSCASTTATISQENGSQAAFTTAGTCTSGTWTPASPRFIATLSYNSGTSTWTYVRYAKDTLTFNSVGELTSDTDLNGNAVTYTWTAGKLTKITDPAARTLTITYTGSLITKVQDSSTFARSVTYGYNDGFGNLTDVTDVGGGAWKFVYDASHRMTSLKDPQCVAATPGH